MDFKCKNTDTLTENLEVFVVAAVVVFGVFFGRSIVSLLGFRLVGFLLSGLRLIFTCCVWFRLLRASRH